MTIQVKHSTTATGADDPNAEVNKAEWNADHNYTMATGRLVGRTSSGTGTFEEIQASTGLSLSGGALSLNATINDLSDVGISGATDGQVLKYSAALGLWVNGTDLTGAGGDTDLLGHIRGLRLSWVSSSAIDVNPGEAEVQSLAAVVGVSSVIHLTGLSLGNSAWGYVYLKSDGTCECNTTAPAAPYTGSARSKSADTTRRFLGAVRTDSSGNIYRFWHNPTIGYYRWQAVDTGSSPFRILSNGNATSSTAVSAAAVVPPQSRMFTACPINLNTGYGIYISSADYAVTTSAFEINIGAMGSASTSTASSKWFTFTCDSSQQINYLMGGSGGGAYIDVDGFYLER